MAQGPLKKNVHPRKLTWIPKMMVWKRWLLLNIAIGPYVVSMFNFWRVNFTICPTKYVTPTSLKVSHWLSQWICIYIYIYLATMFCFHPIKISPAERDLTKTFSKLSSLCKVGPEPILINGVIIHINGLK